MPVTVKTFASSSEAASALSSDRSARYLGGGTLVMRALNEGDISISTVVRATDQALTRIDVVEFTHHARRRRHLRENPGRARSRLSARAGAFDRRAGGAQHGHGRRQSVRAQPLRRFHRRAAGARRHRLRPGRAWRPRHAQSRSSCNRANARAARWCWPSPVQRPASADAFRYRKIARIKPKGGSVITLAAHLPVERRPHIRRAHRARLDGRDADSRQAPPNARWRDARSTMPRSAPPRRPQLRAYRPPTTRSAAPGIAARSSASICAACCPAWSKPS